MIDKKIQLELQNETWMAKNWRPSAAFVYLFICLFDFVIGPILWAVIQAMLNQPLTPWQPLTLQGAGMFHMSMGAILGVAAWTRGKEKMIVAEAEYNQRNHG